MKKTGRKIPPQAKKGLVKIAFLIVGICVALAMPVVASLGWFSVNSANRSTGMSVVVSTGLYDILIDERPAALYNESETNAEGDPVYPTVGEMKTRLAERYSLTALTTAGGSIALELNNEYHDSHGGYNLQPGAYGSLTFYLRPREGVDGTVIPVSLTIGGYVNVYDESDDLDIMPATDVDLLNYLQGHLLFFTGRTGASPEDYRYTGLIDEGVLEYDTSAHDKCAEEGKTDCYRITLYWEWPITYEEIVQETGTEQPPVERKYPPELRTYVAAYPERFFASHADSDSLILLSDGYNDADQAIGYGIHYFTVTIR